MGQGRPEGAPLRVLVLSQFYLPEGALFTRDVAEGLRDQGHEVRVVTGFPNRPEGVLYPGYTQRFGFVEDINGIPVHRVPLYIDYSTNPLARMANFLSFAAAALKESNLARHADVVYVYATPMTAAIPAQVWKSLFGVPFVIHVQDLWPESVTGSGFVGDSRLNEVMGRVLAPWLRSLYRASGHVVGISPGMRDELVRRESDPDRTTAVFNWADEQQVQTKTFTEQTSTEVGFLYAGNLGVMQDLGNVVAGFMLAEQSTGFAGRLVLAGGGTAGEQLQHQAAGTPSVRFTGRVPREVVNELNREADFQLVTLKDLPIFRINVPSKLQAALAAGMPVITTVTGQVADLIAEHRVGFTAQPESPESLAEAFRAAAATTPQERAEMGRRARALYETLMSRQSGVGAITKILTSAARTRLRRRRSEDHRH